MMTISRRTVGAAVLLATAARVGLAEHHGVEIQPDEKGRFEYADDFATARFLDEAFLDNLKVDCWRQGAISNTGPNRNRTLTYRFYGGRAITAIDVRIEQSANARHLGGTNRLLLSGNGLDWTQAASSRDQTPDGNHWQRQPMTAGPEQTAAFSGRTEVWVRIVMDNYSGLKTNTSNTISAVRVKLTLGGEAAGAGDPQAAKRSAWGTLRRSVGWRGLSLDWSDPVDRRPPHYYEDADGWLQPPGAIRTSAIDEREGFLVRRAYLWDKRPPLSLAAFVKTQGLAGRAMVRLVVRCTRESSRKMTVSWDGKGVATFDVASYFTTDRAFFVELPGPCDDGVHELRVAGGDSGSILIRRIDVIAKGDMAWAIRPPLPNGGSLTALSAYYMPDPPPPPDSQAVEGRAKKKTGLVFKGLQRLYKEHAEFGAVRVVLRNTGRVAVRIGNPLLLNGRPIEDSYVDFAKSAWDARGVVWYRVRPALVEPGRCCEVYIRFRHRPEGQEAVVTMPLENGRAVSVKIPYPSPGLSVDYVTTGRTMDTLYVYARRAPGADPGRVLGLSLDGERLADAKIYGAGFPGNVALIVAKLPRALRPYAYHVVGVHNEGKAATTVAAQFRVLPFVFPRGSIHTPADQLARMKMNTAMWRMFDRETCEKYGVTTTCHESAVFDTHSRVSHIFGPDEPDAHDNRGGGYDKGLGWHARRLADSGWQTLVERHAPHAATWLIMNGTVRPMNWFVYGQVADVSCFDPYPVTYYGADHAYVRESLLLARQCGAPSRMHACLEAYGWKTGQGVPKGARGPIPAEYRQNVVQAIGAGMKGLTSWVYSGGAGGWQLNKPLADEIAKLNALIAHIEGDLLLATPIDLATCNAGLVPTGSVGKENWPKPRVWVGTLLSGPDTIVLAVANHIPASKPDLPNIEPARNVLISVQLPDYLGQVSAFEVTEDGKAPVACKAEDGKAVLELDEVTSGRVFILRRR